VPEEIREQADNRPLLLVISDSPAVLAQVRSHQREVRRWLPELAIDASADVFSGDPADEATYAWTRDAIGVTAVIDLSPSERARGALEALRSVRSDAAVLLLSDELRDTDHDRDGTLARSGTLRDVLRLDLDEELRRMEAERRAFCLREFAAGADVVPILIHDSPDPDAVSSALAVSALLDGSAEQTPIVTLGGITRPENRRMADLLHVRITEVTEDELRRFDRIIMVDTQPRGLQQEGRPHFAVIDHHPLEEGYSAAFRDIRPEYGATATMLTEYLRAADGRRVGRPLATALLYGIKTDTDSLTRGVTPADVAAYAFLQAHADLNLLRRFERPSYASATARAFGRALSSIECDDELCVSYLGELREEESHVLADLADFCLGIENVTWVVAAADLEGELVLTLRHAGGEPGAGAVAREIANSGGSGGGHGTMARVVLGDEVAAELRRNDEAAGMAEAIRRLVRTAMNAVKPVNRRGSHPVPRV
jgi:nanoRNase/pAp phosphatase (c-di-AMP/oligoRNAs hydrolase)